MPQGYHKNAKTNLHLRKIIQQSAQSNLEQSKKFNVSEKTIAKWKGRDSLEDKISRPPHHSLCFNTARKRGCSCYQNLNVDAA